MTPTSENRKPCIRAAGQGVSSTALAAADRALATGEVVLVDDEDLPPGDTLALVPDVVEVEGVANGLPPLDDGCWLLRLDGEDAGRQVVVYRVPVERVRRDAFGRPIELLPGGPA